MSLASAYSRILAPSCWNVWSGQPSGGRAIVDLSDSDQGDLVGGCGERFKSSRYPAGEMADHACATGQPSRRSFGHVARPRERQVGGCEAGHSTVSGSGLPHWLIAVSI